MIRPLVALIAAATLLLGACSTTPAPAGDASPPENLVDDSGLN
jgi:starvation-inducible outer membrane lipoprotein